MSTDEKSYPATKHIEEVDAVKTVHLDGTVEYVDAQAVGGELKQMPRGYFMSLQFIGTVTVRQKEKKMRMNCSFFQIGHADINS